MCPKSKEQFEEIRIQRKEAIESAALALFGHKGYANTSISMIAKEAGISKGLMYNYYESKEDLLKSIIEGAMAKGESILDPTSIYERDPIEVLQGIVDQSMSMLMHNLAYWKLLTSLVFQEDAIGQWNDMIKLKAEQSKQMIIPLFEKLGYPEPEKQALLFGSVMDGLFLHYISMDGDYPIYDMVAYLKKQFCKPY